MAVLAYSAYSKIAKSSPPVVVVRPWLSTGGLDLAILEYAEYTRTSKTSKTGHLGVLRSKSSDYFLNCEKITQSNCQEEEKNDKIHFTNDLFFNINNYRNLLGKTEKYLSTDFSLTVKAAT